MDHSPTSSLGQDQQNRSLNRIPRKAVGAGLSLSPQESQSSSERKSFPEPVYTKLNRDEDNGAKDDSAVSKWGIGWQTPLMMGGTYVLALIIAVVHLCIFRYINGKAADGPDEVIPQSYITTISNLLANLFGISLRIALAVAFCQYLWRLLRLSALKVSTIETLFCIRSNPFLLLRPAATKAAPILTLLALIIWSMQVAISFPPGALTVVTAYKTSYKRIEVPTFNASFMGSGSGVDANKYFLDGLAVISRIGTKDVILAKDMMSSSLSTSGTPAPLVELATQIMIAGEQLAMPSLCGANCSYIMEFEGPYLDCTETITNKFTTVNMSASDTFPVYSANLMTADKTNFTATTSFPVAANANIANAMGGTLYSEEHNLTCSPWRAKYVLNNTYENNIQNMQLSTEKIAPLNLTGPYLVAVAESGAAGIPVSNFTAPNSNAFGTTPANWSVDAVNWYRDYNMYTIIEAMTSPLNGTYYAPLYSVGPFNDTIPGAPAFNGTISNNITQGGNFYTHNVSWVRDITPGFFAAVQIFAHPSGGCLVGSSRFSSLYSNFDPTGSSLSINMTQDGLNSLLLNTTLSIMTGYKLWYSSNNATVTTPHNIYSFSRPVNLLLPYFLSLGVAVPFLILGTVALLKNGVSATDGGFLQLLTTCTGSEILKKKAAGGCLGGMESVPEGLLETKIQFGELVLDEQTGPVRRAGFGVPSEVTELQKGTTYGTFASGVS
ncbi:hypothetical protein BP5796_08750 [Coleophoma crateriformis]|uniref:Uncharacterized protein n=1 Tax=Coleophoma crateriformis TaxID=565419 RepID=A0A3D8R8H9_9HELO|nr:hypothetical protein BP5796_08750 [Coleophoma crateriformis]